MLGTEGAYPPTQLHLAFWGGGVLCALIYLGLQGAPSTPFPPLSPLLIFIPATQPRTPILKLIWCLRSALQLCFPHCSPSPSLSPPHTPFLFSPLLPLFLLSLFPPAPILSVFASLFPFFLYGDSAERERRGGAGEIGEGGAWTANGVKIQGFFFFSFRKKYPSAMPKYC